MFAQKTVFILGAGASFEVHLPLGSHLRDSIADAIPLTDKGKFVAGDRIIYDQVSKTPAVQVDDYFAACKRIRDGIRLSDSIDNFLDLHKENRSIQLAGKTQIVRHIVDAERRSKLYVDRKLAANIDYSKLTHPKEVWYVRFIRMLGRDLNSTNIQDIFRNLTFVIFNYDRCFEFFYVPRIEGFVFY
jgi:hypothetical protein